MRRLLAALLPVALAAGVATAAAAQEPRFPETPQGRLAAAFFAAVNSPDEGALARFQEANFSPAALQRRPAEVRLAQNRQLREDAGRLTPVEVRVVSATRLVVTATGSNTPPGLRLTVTFTFTRDDPPRIDQIQISG